MDIEKMLRRKPKKIYSPIDDNWYDWNGKTLDNYPEDTPYILDVKYEDKPLCFKIWSDKRGGYIYIQSFPLKELHRRINCCSCCQIQGFGNIYEENNNRILIRSAFCSDGIRYIHQFSKRGCPYYEQCSLRIWGERHATNENTQRIETDFIIEF